MIYKINMPARIFLSYSSIDYEVVNKIRLFLIKNNINVWFDNKDISYGSVIIHNIYSQLEVSEVVIVFLSTHSLKSNWVQAELNYSLELEIRKNRKIVLPVLIDKRISLPNGLKGRKYFEFLNKFPSPKEFDDLLKIIKHYSNSNKLFPSISLSTSLVLSKNSDIIDRILLGDFSNSVIRANVLYRYYLKNNDLERALIFLCTLVNLERIRGKFSIALGLMKEFKLKTKYNLLNSRYLIKLLKEELVIYHEINDIKSALEIIKIIDILDKGKNLSLEEDRWLPGVILWRKSHLKFMESKDLDYSINICYESLFYYIENNLEKTSGYASALLNMGWLLYLNNDESCYEYFNSANNVSKHINPRTQKEAISGVLLSDLKFKDNEKLKSLFSLGQNLNALAQSSFTFKNYSLLGNFNFPLYKLKLEFRKQSPLKVLNYTINSQSKELINNPTLSLRQLFSDLITYNRTNYLIKKIEYEQK